MVILGLLLIKLLKWQKAKDKGAPITHTPGVYAFEILALAKREKVLRRLESAVGSAFSVTVQKHERSRVRLG
jgi:hypothetical protein